MLMLKLIVSIILTLLTNAFQNNVCDFFKQSTSHAKIETNGLFAMKCKIILDKDKFSDTTDTPNMCFINNNTSIIFAKNSENITDFLKQMRRLNPNLTCSPTSDKFEKSYKWKLEKNEYTIDRNYSVIYQPNYTLYPAGCSWSEDYRKYLLGDFGWRWEDESIYVIIPNCIIPPLYYYDTILAAEAGISAICLLIAIILEILVPMSIYDRRPIICHMISLLIWAVIVVLRYFTKKPNGFMCYVISYGVRYAGRAAISWMTVIVFDMWRHLHKDRILHWNPQGSNKKFMFQSLFAWTIPAIFMLVTYVLQYVNGNTRENCLQPVSHNQVQSLVEHLNPELLQAFNFVLFLIILYNVQQHSKELTSISKRKHKKLWRFFLKLMFVTGAFWLLAIPDWALSAYYEVNDVYELIANVLQYFQGVYLFLIYDCNVTVWKKLYLKLKC